MYIEGTLMSKSRNIALIKLFMLGIHITNKKYVLHMKISHAISRTTVPNIALFVLILMYVPCWFQILAQYWLILKFQIFSEICETKFGVHCIRDSQYVSDPVRNTLWNYRYLNFNCYSSGHSHWKHSHWKHSYWKPWERQFWNSLPPPPGKNPTIKFCAYIKIDK